MRALPPRPSVPPVLPAALAVAAGAACAPSLPGAVVTAGTFVAASVGVAAALFAGFASSSGRRCAVLAWAVMLVACALAGFALGAAAAAEARAVPAWILAHRLYRGYAEVASDPKVAASSWSCDAVLSEGSPGLLVQLRGGTSRAPYRGQRIALVAVLGSASASRSPGLPQAGPSAEAESVTPADDQGILGPLWAARSLFAELLRRRTSDPGVALIGAWTASAVDEQVRARTDAMRAAGVPWLGGAGAAQLALVVFAAGMLGRALPFLSRIRLAPTVLAVTAGRMFCLLAGGRPTLVRAALAVTAYLACALLGRRADALASLAMAIGVAVTASPTAAGETGLWLPVCAVAAVQAVGPLVRAWVADAAPGRARPLAAGVAVGATATLGAAPLAAGAFGQVSGVGPFVAVVCVPPAVLSMTLVTLSAPVMLLAPTPLPQMLLAAAAVPASWTSAIADAVAGSPMAAAPADPLVLAMVCVPLLVALWARWPGPPGRWASRVAAGTVIVALGIPLLVPSEAPPGPVIEVLDVGQGDSIIIRDGPRELLVDAGPDPATLRRALSRGGGSAPDTVLITHAHADHDGGVPALRNVTVMRSAAGPAPAKGGGGVPRDTGACSTRTVRTGDVLSVGRITLTVLWPPEHLPSEDVENENDHSVVLLAECSGRRALLLGDAEVEVQDRLAKEGVVPCVDVVKAAHHGSTNGWSSALEAAARPREALVSVGAHNRFGHPAPSVIDDFSKQGTRVFRTDRQGDLVFDFTTGAVRAARSGESAVVGRAPSGGPALGTCATIAARHADTGSRGIHGIRRHLRTQAGLSDLGRRTRLAGACRGPPPSSFRCRG